MFSPQLKFSPKSFKVPSKLDSKVFDGVLSDISFRGELKKINAIAAIKLNDIPAKTGILFIQIDFFAQTKGRAAGF